MGKYSKSSIISEAGHVKTSIEKTRNIPKSCTLVSTILSAYSTSYLMASVISDGFKSKDYSLTSVVKYNSRKHIDTIAGEEVRKEDYMVMVKNFINYCKDHKRVPSYITTQKTRTKVSFELFMYGLSKIIVFYQKNKYLPNYCTFNKSTFSSTASSTTTSKKSNVSSTSSSKKKSKCTNPYTSAPHLTDSNMGQDTKYSCANNSEQQDLYKLLSIIFKESDLMKWSGTTTAGTSHQGIDTCIAYVAKKYNVKLTTKWVYFSDLGKTTEERFKALAEILCQQNKALLTHIAYMSGGEDEFNEDGPWYGHYEVIRRINIKTKMVQVLNSLGVKNSNGSYKGKLQERSYKVEASYLRNTPGGQKAICIITKG